MNINNIIKLIKAYFYENWRNDLIYSFGIMAALSLIMTIVSGSPFLAEIKIAAVVFMVYYPCRFFSKLHQPSSRIHYLMTPVTNAEKVVTGMFLTNIYFVAGIVLSVLIGQILGYGIVNMYKPGIFAPCGIHNLGEFLKMQIPTNGLKVMMFFTSISTMFFAAIYFKKSPFWKLLLVGFVITLVVGAIMAGVEWLNVVLTIPAEIRNGHYYKVVEHNIVTSSNWFSYVAYSVSIVYFYAMSFLRMRETEA
jgi:hypothetical protein